MESTLLNIDKYMQGSRRKAVPKPWTWWVLGLATVLPFVSFLRELVSRWTTDPEFSYGMMIPIVAVALVFMRRKEIVALDAQPWTPAIVFLLAGSLLRIMGSLSGSLLASGIAFSLVLIGIVGFVWGKAHLRKLAVPIGYLVFMCPLPNYLAFDLSWRLQSMASSLSAGVLRLLGVTVFQDGNLLVVPNYVLEVQHACSGTRSLFALVALAVTLGIAAERSHKRWLIRALLVLVAPALALTGNLVRIVGTGLLATSFGSLAADESLHAAWGIAVFVVAVAGLLGVHKLLPWLLYRSA